MPSPASIAAISAPVPPSSPPGRITRADVLSIARSGDAWRGIPLCLQVLRVMPEDHEMRCQTAALFARLGLRTPATNLLEELPAAVRELASVRTLTASVEQLPDDRLDIDSRRQTAESNLACLPLEPTAARLHVDRWLETLSQRECLRTNDGNVVVRDASGTSTRFWIRFRNDALEAAKFPLPHLAPENAGSPPRAYTIEGIDPPFLFRRIARETPPLPDGYQPLLNLIQRDWIEFLDGLSLIDLRTELASPRIRAYIGENATEQFAAALQSRLDYQIVGPCITLATIRHRSAPSAEQTLAAAAASQAEEDRSLRAHVNAAYTPDTLRDIQQAIAATAARTPATRPLRVLVPTCRYSTFIQHASADLVEAFRAAGHEARLLIEDDSHSRFSSIAYLRAIADFTPDLVVLINYTRSHFEGVMPANLPFVTWLQDSMPHQFNAETGRKQGPADFLIGHLHQELFTQFGYPEARRASMPMVVSTKKFHDGAVTAEQAERYSCDLAYVSHHSETPDEMHRRLVKEAGAGTAAARIFSRLEPRVREIALACAERPAHAQLRQAAADAIAESTLRDPDERVVTQFTRQYCMPLADRIVRHQTLEWAADIARRHGWRLHIYGRGWEKHARFRSFAKGELPHDEDLRAAYQLARLHLHATINTPVHQRIMEGAMSGGLVACRLHLDAMTCLTSGIYDAVIRESAPDPDRSNDARGAYPLADSPDAMSLVTQMQRLGAKTPVHESGCLLVLAATLARHRSRAHQLVRDSVQLHDVVGDLSDLTFRNATELERLAIRAVSDNSWRSSRSRLVADRVRARMTHDALARRIIELVASSPADVR